MRVLLGGEEGIREIRPRIKGELRRRGDMEGLYPCKSKRNGKKKMQVRGERKREEGRRSKG
jgi:hypothetical protein